MSGVGRRRRRGTSEEDALARIRAYDLDIWKNFYAAMGRRVVENDDYFGSLLRMASGARVTLDCSRVAVGEQNSYGFEIHGTRGALSWDFRRMGELGVASGASYQDEPVRTIFVGPHDADFAAFQPGAGIPIGYDDLKVIEAARFLRSIADNHPHGATLTDAIRAAEALDAMEQSATSGAWVTLTAGPRD